MSNAIDLSAVKRGFADPALEAQVLFRKLMTAMSRPGIVQDFSEAPEPPRGFYQSTAGIALTLLDFETRVWLDPALRGDEAEAWLRFHCNAPLTVEPELAQFAIVADAATSPPLAEFHQGTARYPDQSTTVILQVASLTNGESVVLEGPGIKEPLTTNVTGLPADFWQQWRANGEVFQFGVDVMMTDDASVLALPRTTRVKEDS